MNPKDLAKNLPYPLKQGLKYVHAVIPRPIRYGKASKDTYKFLQESQYWRNEKIGLPTATIKQTFASWIRKVSYYRMVFNERDLTKGYSEF